MQFDTTQYLEMMGSVLVDDAVKDIPLFGEEKKSAATIASQVVDMAPPKEDSDLYFAKNDYLLESLAGKTTTAEKILILRKHAHNAAQNKEKPSGSKYIAMLRDVEMRH